MRARLEEAFVRAARAELARNGIDGWLLYDLEARNRVAAELLGVPGGMSRRIFVLIRPEEEPVALAHSIELHHWATWQGRLIEYVGWRELEEKLGELVAGCAKVAMEVSAGDAIPFIDNVPVGVVELVASLGVEVVSSAPLISATYAQWGEVGLRTHRRAGAILAETARAAFDRACAAVGGEKALGEHDLARWIIAHLEKQGLTETETIVAVGANSANPHYFPSTEHSSPIPLNAIVMIDLWGRLAGEPEAVFADQTWMGFTGAEPPAAFMEAWEAIRTGRDAAVELIAERVADGSPPTGADVDREVRRVLTERGFAHQILHRTGHAMDRVNHGFGPNLDAVETRDTRILVPGIGFSVEPGLYFRGRFGLRTEINVYMQDDGPEVTTPSVQGIPWTLETG